jgi:hypothetical protein
MSDELYESYKKLMKRLKARKYQHLFTVNDLIEAICSMPADTLDPFVDRVMKNKDPTLRSKLKDISPEAKAQIEAILAAEAAKK